MNRPDYAILQAMSRSSSRRKWWLFICLLAVGLAAFVAGVLVSRRFLHPAAPHRETPSLAGDLGFTDEDRVRYRTALERLRYELRAGPKARPFEEVVSPEAIREAIRLDAKKERLLQEYCRIEIGDDMIEAELERVKAEPGNPEVLVKIVDALDGDPRAIVVFWLRPVLVDRYLRACVAEDRTINAEARAKAQRTREKALAGGAAAEIEIFRLSAPELEPEDREALAGLKPGQKSGLLESPEDFHFFVVQTRAGDTVTAAVRSEPKPDFEHWFQAQP